MSEGFYDPEVLEQIGQYAVDQWAEDDEANYSDADLEALTAYKQPPIDPMALHAHIEQKANEIAAKVHAQNEQNYAILAANQPADAGRQAADAMTEKYGQGWQDVTSGLADKLRVAFAAGHVPTDAQALAEFIETQYLAERERNRPTREQEDQAHWERVQAANQKSYADG
jgi:nitroreductase